MKVSQINNNNFMGGSVKLKSIKPEDFGAFGSIKNFAENNEIDVEISKIFCSKGLHTADVYLVTASKNNSENVIDNDEAIFEGIKSLVTNLKISKEEFSVRLFNTFMYAVEMLQKQIGNIK